MEQLRDNVQEVFRAVFGDDELCVTDTTIADDVDGWDSLMHLNLIVALEKRFGIRFATAEISKMKETGQNVGALIELVNRKLK
jgi:acyl carrier protein